MPEYILIEALAVGFYRAAGLMKGQLHPMELPPDTVRMVGGYGDLVPPMIVCLTFACELMLKALLSQTGQQARHTHDLRLLVKDLPENERVSIKTHIGDMAAKFDEHIAAHSKTFVDWRYVYASKVTVIADESFLDALYKAASQCVRPDGAVEGRGPV